MIGDSLLLQVIGSGPGGSSPAWAVVWTSLAPGTATVDSFGKVRGRAIGKASIVATVSGWADTATVFVQLPTLRRLASARQFTMGAAANTNAFEADEVYRWKLAAEYNTVVAENAMKFGVIHPAPTQYAFAVADEIVAFAQANHMGIHGHTLVWHQELPAWVTAGGFTKEQLLAILKDHIATVVGRYRGKIATWDVVNEAVDGYATALRNTIWLEVIGPEYIDSAFTWANRADPAAHLFINDFDIEGVGAKSDSLLSLVRALRARGVPVHGVGFQAHFTMTPPAASDIETNLARFTSLGLDVRVSEMDVQVPDSAGAAALAQEAIIYRDMLDACLLQQRCVSFTTWGFTDRYSYLPTQHPGFGRGLPLDSSYAPKPAYAALSARLQQP